MPVIAVVNRKGGSGKSTIATHVAAYCSIQSIAVMLGDVDKQQSTRSWLKLREQLNPSAKPIQGWAVLQSSALRAPNGVSHVVLDTPGGLHGLDLARVVMFADAILMPICNSVFDRESAAQCFDELKQLPRIASGRCKLAVVGMRVDNRAQDSATLTQWAQERSLPYLGALRDAQCYVECAEQGLTIFDLPRETVSQDLAQWDPLLNWISPILFPASPLQGVERSKHTSTENTLIRSSRAISLQPIQQSLVQGASLTQNKMDGKVKSSAISIEPKPAKRLSLMDAWHLPHFLRRK